MDFRWETWISNEEGDITWWGIRRCRSEFERAEIQATVAKQPWEMKYRAIAVDCRRNRFHKSVGFWRIVESVDAVNRLSGFMSVWSESWSIIWPLRTPTHPQIFRPTFCPSFLIFNSKASHPAPTIACFVVFGLLLDFCIRKSISRKRFDYPRSNSLIPLYPLLHQDRWGRSYIHSTPIIT